MRLKSEMWLHLSEIVLCVAVIFFWYLTSGKMEFMTKVQAQVAPIIQYSISELSEKMADQQSSKENHKLDILMKAAGDQIPIYRYSISRYDTDIMSEKYQEYVKVLLTRAEETRQSTGQILWQEGENDADILGIQELPEIENAEGEPFDQSYMAEENQGDENLQENEDAGENENKQENAEGQNAESNFRIDTVQENAQNAASALFTPKRVNFNMEDYADWNTFLQKFYTVDNSTTAPESVMNPSALMGADMKLQQDNSKPQILIYHTHSQEGYAGVINAGDTAVTGEKATVVEAGEYLAEILRQQYGYQVIHHTGEYDVGVRDYAYSYALPAIEKVLQENPSIEVVIDLHRDAVAEGTKLLTNIEGADCAQFMFFNGVSYVNDIGKIEYLPNEHLQENLAFSLQLQVTSEEYFPGLARKMYLKGYRYNMHLRGKSLLVELGAQTNTLTEAQNACWPLARALHLVLSGDG